MASQDEGIIFPDKSLFLVHKLQSAKGLGQTPQWQTRSTGTSAGLGTPITKSGPALKDGHAKPPALEFVGYSHHRTTIPPGRKSRKATSKAISPSPKKPRRNARWNLKQQNAKNRGNGSPNVAQLGNEPIPDQTLLGNAILDLSVDLPASLSNHSVLYINFYFHVITANAYPLSSLLCFNPAQKNWFPHMLGDEVWLYIILSLSASTLASITNHSTSHQDADALLDSALHRLNRRISADQIQSDETLGAVACLANWSNGLGDQEKSWTHTRGLAELVTLRGGLSRINKDLRSKMYRGMLEVAVDSDNLSFTQKVSQLTQVTGVEMVQSPIGYHRNVQCSCQVHPILTSIFQDISKLSAGLADAVTSGTRIDPDLMDSTVFSLLQRLLLCGSANMDECDSAFRICLILYIKSLTCQIDRLVTTSTILVRKLQAYIGPCPHCKSSLTIWKLFFGCLATANGTPEREWFEQSLSVSSVNNTHARLDGWAAVQKELGSVLWINSIHGKPGKLIWSQICKKLSYIASS